MTVEGLRTNWRDETRRLLKSRPATLKLKDISEQTGIPEGWLTMFQQGKISGPDVNRIETLHHFLKENKAKDDNVTIQLAI